LISLAGYKSPAEFTRTRCKRDTSAQYQRLRAAISPGDVVMKHPLRSDFQTAVSEAGVVVTFRPTGSIYSFYRLAGSEDIARLAPTSSADVRHAAPGGDTSDYPAEEVQDMAQRLAAEIAKSVWSAQDGKIADELTRRGYSIAGDDDVINTGETEN
jgi:hypothetical protein